MSSKYENNHKFETLLKGNAPKDQNFKWYPISVANYQKAIKIEQDEPNDAALSKNIAYNLQYLEYLQKQLNELEVSSVLTAMLIKNYVITGVSILEGIFSYIVKKNGLWKVTREKTITNFKKNVKVDKQDVIITTTISRPVEQTDIPSYKMTYDTLLNILKENPKILKIGIEDSESYKSLDKIREIRNRIHLYSTDTDTVHDYMQFSTPEEKEKMRKWKQVDIDSDKNEDKIAIENVLKTMQSLLYKILTLPDITTDPEYFDFLKPTETEK